MKRLNLIPLYFLALLCELKCARVYTTHSFKNILDNNIILYYII